MNNIASEKIIVIGGKGTAINIAEHIVHARTNFSCKQEFIGFAIDDESLGKEINGFPILCKINELHVKFKNTDIKLIYALYRPDAMKERVDLFKNLHFEFNRFTNFVHPTAYIAPSVKIGLGNAILSNTSIQSNVFLGNYNIINSSVVIEHNTVVKNHNFIAASACLGANVAVGNGVFIGMNASVRERVIISDFSFIGMGSNLLADIENGQIAYGNPARVKK